jgi:TonB family protein
MRSRLTSARTWQVLGRVTQVGESKDRHTLFLNFGGRYPNHVFDAVVLSKNLQSFPEARSWEGKNITVRGKIQLYKGRGKPEIILERQEQVTMVPNEMVVPRTVAGLGGGVAEGVLAGDLGQVPGGADTEPRAEKDLVGRDLAVDFDRPPRPLKQSRPVYPQEAFNKGVEGTVLVEILIDSQGRVARARVIQSVPLLEAAALQTVYKWVFQPALKHGRPVATIAHIPVTFRIYSNVPSEPAQRRQRPLERANY